MPRKEIASFLFSKALQHLGWCEKPDLDTNKQHQGVHIDASIASNGQPQKKSGLHGVHIINSLFTAPCNQVHYGSLLRLVCSHAEYKSEVDDGKVPSTNKLHTRR